MLSNIILLQRRISEICRSRRLFQQMELHRVNAQFRSCCRVLRHKMIKRDRTISSYCQQICEISRPQRCVLANGANGGWPRRRSFFVLRCSGFVRELSMFSINVALDITYLTDKLRCFYAVSGAARRPGNFYTFGCLLALFSFTLRAIWIPKLIIFDPK